MDGESTVRELIQKLTEENPPEFREAVLFDGEIRDHLRLFRNGHPMAGDQFDEALEDGDQFMLFPAVAGG